MGCPSGLQTRRIIYSIVGPAVENSSVKVMHRGLAEMQGRLTFAETSFRSIARTEVWDSSLSEAALACCVLPGMMCSVSLSSAAAFSSGSVMGLALPSTTTHL